MKLLVHVLSILPKLNSDMELFAKSKCVFEVSTIREPMLGEVFETTFEIYNQTAPTFRSSRAFYPSLTEVAYLT